MSLQSSTFNTSNVLDNEIIKASDFNFAFEKLIENVSKSTQMMLESTQDFVINGKVSPYQGMNVQVAPIYGVCKSTGIPFGRTETAVMEYGFEESANGRVDIIQVKGDWETYDNQQRAFNDPDTDTQTYQYVDTKKLMRPVYQIKKGVEGSAVAPTVDSGWVKLAEVVIRANASTLLASDIKNITADVAGMDNDDWTTEKDETYNIGYISDVNARFRVAHNEDGTHQDDCIDANMLDIGIGADQVNGNVLPVGGAVTIPSQAAIASTDSIYSVIIKAVNVITSLYNNYLKFGTYGFEGEVQISDTDTSDILDNPLKLSADGAGNAFIKVGNTTVLSIDTYGKLHTCYDSVISTDDDYTIVTKAITDAISTALDALTTRVTNIENTSDTTVYANGTLSAGTDGRYNVDSTSIAAATTANVTLSGNPGAIDGVTLTDGQYVLVKAQTNAKENGIYQYSSNSTWNRVNDFLSPNALKGKLFTVTNGTANGKRMFYLTKVNFVDGSDFGSDDIIFSEYFASINSVADRLVMRKNDGSINANVTGNVTGNCSGSSGSCTGNATSSDYSRQCAYCTTAAATQAKVANMRGFAFANGQVFLITFTNSNSYNGTITLNVNGTGAVNIWINGAVSSASNKTLNAGTYFCQVDGGVYKIDTSWGVPYARSASYAASANSASTATSATSASSASYATSAGSASSASSATNADKVDGYHVSTAAGTTKNDSLNALVPVSKQYFTSTSGYIVYANGLIIQWGSASSSGEIATGSFLISFTSLSSYKVVATKNTNTSGSNYSLRIYDKAKQSFKCYSSLNCSIDFIAIGY